MSLSRALKSARLVSNVTNLNATFRLPHCEKIPIGILQYSILLLRGKLQIGYDREYMFLGTLSRKGENIVSASIFY